MALRLEPMGTLIVYIDDTWNFTGGPIAGRSCTAFRKVTWDGPLLKARSIWGNGTYQNGPEMADANIRVLFRTIEGAQLYLDYLARVHLPSHVQGLSPSIMSGRVEVNESDKHFAWLNRTQTYETYALRWKADSGPIGLS